MLHYLFIRTIFSSIFMPQHSSNITGAHVVQKLYSQEHSKTLPLANDAFPMLQFSIAWQHPSPGLGYAPIKNAGHLLHASLITFPSGSRFILELKKSEKAATTTNKHFLLYENSEASWLKWTKKLI